MQTSSKSIRSNSSRSVGLLTFVCVAALGLTFLAPGADAKTRRKITKKSTKSTRVTTTVAPDFIIRFLGDARTVEAGASTNYAFALSATGTLPGAVVFDVPDLQPGVTAKVSASSATSYTLDVSTTSAAVGGSAVYAIRGRSGDVIRTALFRLTITPAPTTTVPGATTTTTIVTGDFSLTTDSSTLTPWSAMGNGA